MQKSCGYRVQRLFNDSPNPTYVPKPWHIVINWGNGNVRSTDFHGISRFVNSHTAVAAASNKLITFQKLKDKDGIRIPVFTTDRSVAASWLGDGIGVVCRTKLNGHSGDGIVLALQQTDEIPNASLYVHYIKKQKEFRVHVAFGAVIDVQEKRKRTELPEDFITNFQVRNHSTGWVYCREEIQEPEGLRQMAVQTVGHLGLDFGAVDIIWNEKRNECYVLEVNTAPGLEGTTVTKYAEAFVRHLK